MLESTKRENKMDNIEATKFCNQVDDLKRFEVRNGCIKLMNKVGQNLSWKILAKPLTIIL